MDLARAVNAEIGRGGQVHPDSDEELQHFQSDRKGRENLEGKR